MTDARATLAVPPPPGLARWLAGRTADLPFERLPDRARALAFVVGRVLRLRRGHVERSMARAGVDPALAPAFYASLATTVLETLWLAARPRDLGPHVVFDGPSLEAFERARAGGRGLVLAASHTGSFDLAACAVARLAPLLVITKRLKPASLDALWQSGRAAYGVRPVEPAGALRQARPHLAAGGAVAMMIDQVPGRRAHGLPCEFLGAPALVDRAPAALAARTGAPLVVPAQRRLEDGRQELLVLGVLEPPADAGPAWVEHATRRATSLLDAFVRANPTEWMWLHRRWRAPRGVRSFEKNNLSFETKTEARRLPGGILVR
jgi:KDO2-lipid IV(A) lauroyltransferase